MREPNVPRASQLRFDEQEGFALAPAPTNEPVPRLYAEIALKRPVRREFTYAVPLAMEERIAVGTRVAVPFGGRREIGVVVALSRETQLDPKRVRPIARLLDETPLLDQPLLELTRWMASYYACAWGEALAAVLPAALKREGGTRQMTLVTAAAGVGDKELAELETSHPRHHRLLRTLLELREPIELKELCRKHNLSTEYARTLEKKGLARFVRVDARSDPLLGPVPTRKRPDTLSDDQQRALDGVGDMLRARTYKTFLLHGVTGSGKTEVYLRAIEEALALGRGAIVLVPEIALTPQTVGWFRSRFGDVALLHSRMTDAQRRGTWLRVQRGELRVVVGARSAIFAPVADLGVIVVDEEHEPSFKQAETPRYHARDVAVMRAVHANAVCILGSATPALETWHNARTGRYGHLRLHSRPSGGALPRVEIVDLREEAAELKGSVLFSRRLRELLEHTFAQREQALLFQNRRGFAPVLWCRACGETVRCASCDVSLALHKRIGRLVCHSCCEELPPPRACPSCTAPALRFLGSGSERIEHALRELLPTARVARMDSDTMVRREDYEDVLTRFGAGELDVLVGTQMIAKGLDFPRVTLVGIVSADAALHMPDFRASERTFQLLSQVAGRAGRGALAGRIVVQTSTPAHPAITHAARHDYDGFALQEAKLREELGYPPFGRLIRAVFDDEDAARVEAGAAECADTLRAAAAIEGVQLLGPAEAPIGQLRGRFRRHLLLKARAEGAGLPRLRSLLLDWGDAHPRPRLTIDVDPVSLL